jgi:hypothetical protein
MVSMRYMAGGYFSGVGEVTKFKVPDIPGFVKNSQLRGS